MGLQDLKYSEITQKIIGAAIKVHNKLGPGFQEIIYQRALAIEMRKVGLNFEMESEMSIIYDGENKIGKRRTDFLVEEKILLELKAKAILDISHKAQALNCLNIYKIEVGLLINFGAKKLEFKRLIMTKDYQSNKLK